MIYGSKIVWQSEIPAAEKRLSDARWALANMACSAKSDAVREYCGRKFRISAWGETLKKLRLAAIHPVKFAGIWIGKSEVYRMKYDYPAHALKSLRLSDPDATAYELDEIDDELGV